MHPGVHVLVVVLGNKSYSNKSFMCRQNVRGPKGSWSWWRGAPGSAYGMWVRAG